MNLIIDIGGTRGRWYVVDKSIVSSYESSGFNPFTSNINVLKDILENLEDKFKFNSISHIYYYGAGISTDNKKIIVKNQLEQFFRSSKIEMYSDLFGSCRALCNDKEGVVCILGTGSNSCYFDGKKIINKVNSLGYLLGDEGSGYDIGKKFLRLYLRGELPEKLEYSFKQEYDVLNDMLERLYINSNQEKFISSIAKFILKNKEHNFLKVFINDHFIDYFDKIILKYSSKSIYMTGSIAYYFKDEIELVAKMKGYKIIKVVKDPINQLCDFHIKH
jgi:glucosamine kinase|tara:strand:+ start:614 stop:1438 length:825 start_codon:yes stop_codon:yes gene_type:complete